jgi:hypothetical protein
MGGFEFEECYFGALLGECGEEDADVEAGEPCRAGGLSFGDGM